MDFSVKYTFIPFTIKEIYTPVMTTEKIVPGFFLKNADMPGSQIVTLPSAIVDVTDDHLIIYSCVDELGIVHAEEIIFATRNPTVTENELEALKAIAAK